MTIIKIFSKYGTVAYGSAVIDYISFSIFLFVGFNNFLSQVVSRILGGIFSFLVNKEWSFNFSKKGYISKQAIRFLILYFFSYIISITLFFLFLKILLIPVYFSKILSDTICFFFNFFVMKYYVFKVI